MKDGRFGLSRKLQEALGAANDLGWDVTQKFKDAGFDTVPESEGPYGKASFKTLADWIEKNL